MDSPRRKGRPKSFNAEKSVTRIQSLDRALDVLDVLAENSGMTLTELAEALGQSPSTVYRVLSTFETRGAVEVDPAGQTWHIGSGIFRVGTAFLRRTSILERSLPVMQELMNETGETANLGVEQAGQVLFVGQVESDEPIRAFFPPGTMSPMYASGIGKALLSCYSDTQLERYFSKNELARFTELSITEPELLKADLTQASALGWALDNEEKASGMRCVAAPIFDHTGKAVAGISISGPISRVGHDQIPKFGQLVRDAAKKVSISLGA